MALSANMRGAAYMTAAMAGFAFNDAMMKSLAGEVPLFQAIFVRGLFATALVAALAWRGGVASPRVLDPRDRGLATIRVVAEIATTACFLTALFNMPIADATAIMQFTPLALTLIAAVLLRERTDLRRWVAIAAGFFGVLLILRPGREGVDPAAIWALGAVAGVVVRDLATRRLSAGTPSMFITLMTAVAITVLGGVITLVEGWRPLTWEATLLMAAAAAFLFGGYYCSVRTMREGDIGFVSPFRYSIMLWAMALGLIVFGEWPDLPTMIGAAIVVAAGLYTFMAERRSA